MKTHKGMKRRLKVTKTGKILHMGAGKRHLLSCKSSKRKRGLRKWSQMPKQESAKMKEQYLIR